MEQEPTHSAVKPARVPWNKGKLVGAKSPLVVGAMAPPRNPAKVCTEKACPIRPGSMFAERIE